MNINALRAGEGLKTTHEIRDLLEEQLCAYSGPAKRYVTCKVTLEAGNALWPRIKRGRFTCVGSIVTFAGGAPCEVTELSEDWDVELGKCWRVVGEEIEAQG